MSLAELSVSPAEHIPFDSGSEGLPVRGYGLTTVKSRATPLDFTSPSIIDAFLFSFIETFEEASCDFRAVVLRQIEYLLKQRAGSVSHTGSLTQVKDTRGFPFGFIAEWRAIWHVRRTELQAHLAQTTLSATSFGHAEVKNHECRRLTRGRTRRGPASARRPSRLVQRYLDGGTPPAARELHAAGGAPRRLRHAGPGRAG